MFAEVVQEIAIHAAEEPLSDREVVVLLLVAKEKANKAIAHELSLSEDTIKAHLASLDYSASGTAPSLSQKKRGPFSGNTSSA